MGVVAQLWNRLPRLAAPLLVGAAVLSLAALEEQLGFPTRGHPNLALRPADLWPLRGYLLVNMAWVALLGAVVVGAVAELLHRGHRLPAIALASLVQLTLALPLLAGRSPLLTSWRPLVLAVAVALTVAAFWLVLAQFPRWLARRGERRVDRVAVPLVASLAALGLALGLRALLTWEHIGLYPSAVLIVLFWLQALVAAACATTPMASTSSAGFPLRVGVALLLAAVVAAAALDVAGASDRRSTARLRSLVRNHAPGLASLTELTGKGRREWLKVAELLSPAGGVIRHVDPSRLAGNLPPKRRMNVVLFVIDALRRDHTGIGNPGLSFTPRLDALAAGSTTYERAWAPAPATGLAMASCLTGLPPHVIATMTRVPLFLPTYLVRQGYEAVSLFNARDAQLRAYPVLAPISMEDLGVQVILPPSRKRARKREKDRTRVTALIDRLATAKKPRFEYIHLIATHGPFRGASAERRYRKAVKGADLELGRLVDALEATGALDDTVLAVFGDHGEGLGEHGMYAHAQALYAEQTAVPLVVRVPGRSPELVSRPTSLSALPGIVMEALGGRWFTAVDEAEIAGSLDRDIAVQELHLGGELIWRAIQEPPLVYHHRYLEDRVEIYDLARDPGELENLSGKDPTRDEKFGAYEARIDSWETRTAAALSGTD